jgi:hypothetical protein
MSEESRAVEFRRQQTARAAWLCEQRHAAFPSNPTALAAFRANWLPVMDKNRDWDVPLDCEQDPRGLQIP